MSRLARSVAAIILAPVLAATALATPAAHAWQLGGTNLHYEYTDQRWKTTVNPAARLVSGTDYITTNASNCASHCFHYKRHNTLAPSTTLISLGLTSGDLCGFRHNSKTLSNQGTVTVFGNFKAVRPVNPLTNWIEG